MTSLSQDVRYSLRMLLKDKGFTVIAALTLAFGIGFNIAMFSVLNTFLFKSLPYPQSERLVRIWRTSPHSQNWPFSAANFFDQHDQNTVFEKMAAFNFTSRNMTGQGQTAERLLSLAATADFFPMFGVDPAHGRVFKSEEFEPGADNVIILTDRFWASRFSSTERRWR
jgi:putative ABC transport system permease protein